MVNDSKAEALEEKGLYRRAAARWMNVMYLCAEDGDREWVRRHMDECLQKVRRPPSRPDSYHGLSEAATQAQNRMGIGQPNGQAFRMKSNKVK
ncbi:PerC family transcriptional regulator [Pluralibacter gergoviae]|uniref:PerC family transcriptional regulator n=1 Tax=Pluralibacter gergoviae TaxID=61647 RepID=UPI0005ED1E74|nr:PerC family transcriptional regulator [Pluralibacter gergoviae]KJM65085.1 transcriptional regulator [Pluralibacter gergoviae]OUR00220.1 PerC family transcriptional regulator [Pluralibacter gergoviae]